MRAPSSSSLAIAAVALATVIYSSWQAPRLVLDMADGGNGLQVMRHEVTIGEWKQCVAEHACGFMPKPGVGATGDHFPVTGIGILDAQEYAAWASRRTGLPLRLPTMAEWYGFSGVTPVRPVKIFTDPRLAWAETYGEQGKQDPTLRQSGGFGANSLGISDVTGNVWEWTASCVTARTGGDASRCPAYYAAGEHEARLPVFVRDPQAGGCAIGTPPAHLGMRLVYGGKVTTS